MQFVQKQKGRVGSFIAVDNQAKATHYFDDDGKLKVLNKNKMVNNVPVTNESPLPLPKMNFSKDKDKARAANNAGEEPLPLPAMQF